LINSMSARFLSNRFALGFIISILKDSIAIYFFIKCKKF
jgi:hypothetical protein